MLRNEEYRDGFYEVQNSTSVLKLIHLYDPPHLLKGIKNSLLTKNLIFNVNGTQKEASWKDIIALNELDSSISDVKMLPRLNSEHVIPEKN